MELPKGVNLRRVVDVQVLNPGAPWELGIVTLSCGCVYRTWSFEIGADAHGWPQAGDKFSSNCMAWSREVTRLENRHEAQDVRGCRQSARTRSSAVA